VFFFFGLLDNFIVLITRRVSKVFTVKDAAEFSRSAHLIKNTPVPQRTDTFHGVM